MKDKIRQIFSLSPRRSGKSYTLIQGCLQTGATLVVHNRRYANQLKQQFSGLDVVTLDDADKLRGLHKNIIVDHHVYELREFELEQEISRLHELLTEKAKEQKDGEG